MLFRVESTSPVIEAVMEGVLQGGKHLTTVRRARIGEVREDALQGGEHLSTDRGSYGRCSPGWRAPPHG